MVMVLSSCSQQSLAIQEEMAGTAPSKISFFVLLDYRKRWPARFSLDDLEISSDLRDRIEGLLESRSDSRLLLIRRPRNQDQPRILIVDTIREESFIADLDSDWSTDGYRGFQTFSEPFTLVCTHGSRDACCAKLGGLFFRALHRLSPRSVWQASHLGGHRFAATAIQFPVGRLYGRLLPTDAPQFIGVDSPDLPHKLRGLTRYERPAQFVEAMLMRSGGQSLLFQEQISLSADRWRIRFQSKTELITTMVERVATDLVRCSSCSDQEPRPVFAWSMDHA